MYIAQRARGETVSKDHEESHRTLSTKLDGVTVTPTSARRRRRLGETVSKDLYVLRRAAEVYQGLTDRFAPQQRTDYVALFNEWAVGFYTEV